MYRLIYVEEDSPLTKNHCFTWMRVENQQLEANDDQKITHRLQDISSEPINKFFYWNEKPGTNFVNEFNNSYDKIVCWRKNFSQQEQRGNLLLTKWRGWKRHGFMIRQSRTLFVLHVMPTLLLQKPRKNSKSKDHLKSLERRFEIWKEGNISQIYEEGKTIQDWLESDESSNDIVKISKKFKLQI